MAVADNPSPTNGDLRTAQAPSALIHHQASVPRRLQYIPGSMDGERQSLAIISAQAAEITRYHTALCRAARPVVPSLPGAKSSPSRYMRSNPPPFLSGICCVAHETMDSCFSCIMAALIQFSIREDDIAWAEYLGPEPGPDIRQSRGSGGLWGLWRL